MSSAFTVRTATPGDEAAVGAVLAVAFPVLMAPAYEPAVMAKALPLMTRPNRALLAGGTYHVATNGEGQLIGCGGWTHDRPGLAKPEPDLAHIRHFATDPGWLRQGVGRALFERSAAQARAAAVHRLQCYSSLNAEPFYAGLGFRTVRRIDVPMAPGVAVPSVLMERAL